MEPKVGITIPVHDAFPYVDRLLDDLVKTEASTVPIVFVDDASKPDTAGLVRMKIASNPTWGYLRNATQQLFTRTVNRGWRALEPDTDIYIQVNTDCELKPGWLDFLVSAFDALPKIGMIGYPDGTPPPTAHQYEEVFYPHKEGFADYVTGHCFAVSREALLRVGVLCETDPQQAHLASERLLCWRLLSAGYTCWYANSDYCVHDHGGPSWSRNLGLLQFWMQNLKLWKGKDTL